VINRANADGEDVKNYQNKVFIRYQKHLMDIKTIQVKSHGTLNKNETNW
jgi:hypothetical protein